MGEVIPECHVSRLGLLPSILRFTGYERLTRFEVEVRTHSGSYPAPPRGGA